MNAQKRIALSAAVAVLAFALGVGTGREWAMPPPGAKAADRSGESSSVRAPDRRELLLAATKDAPERYAQVALYTEEQEGPEGAAVESAVLLSWINQLLQRSGDHSWLEQRLGAIAYRGGPRNKEDEAYLKLKLAEDEVAALTTIIRERQLEVANGFFGIHSGSYDFEFEPMPKLRFIIGYDSADEDFERSRPKPLPNALDNLFIDYTSDTSSSDAG